MKKKSPASCIIRDCSVQMHPFIATPELIGAVRALAEAALANAKAIEVCAQKLCGPVDNRVGITVGS